jgi:hypothetical protein
MSEKKTNQAPAPPPKPLRKVVVPHLDSPPALGREIHPRRPAPVVPALDDDSEDRAESEGDSDDSRC